LTVQKGFCIISDYRWHPDCIIIRGLLMSRTAGFLFLTFLVLGIAGAQNVAGKIVGVPWTGAKGISRTTAELMQQQSTAAVLHPPNWVRPSLEFEMEREGLQKNSSSPDVSQWPPLSKSSPPDHTLSTTGPQTVVMTFKAATFTDCYAFPPDDMGAVGPTQYIIDLNGRIRSFSKSTGTADLVLNVDTDVFFASVLSPNHGTFTTDPRIRYDRFTGRWFLTMIDVPAGTGTIPDRVMIAVSNSGTITNSTVWTFFYFQQDQVSPTGDTGWFADYPTLGVDYNALYIGVNIFKSTGYFYGTTAFVVRKSSILGSGPIVVTAFRDLVQNQGTDQIPNYTSGPYTPQGVDNFDSTATVGYFIGVDINFYGLLQIRRVSNPGGTPTMSGNITLSVPLTSDPLPVNHLGNTGGIVGRVDGIDERLMSAVIRNGNLWTAHAIYVNASGSTSGANRDAARWYQISNLSTSPSLVQSGTVYDPTTPNDTNQLNYWIPAINVSGQGHVAMGFSAAGTNARLNTATIGRLATDPSGTMSGTPVLFTNSTTSYNPSLDPATFGSKRWGDYSNTSVDPNDDMTMWTTSQYCDGTDSYGVQVAKLLAPPPATPTTSLPDTANRGVVNYTLTLTGASSGGSGFFDPGPTFANHLSATVNGGGVTVNSVTYTNPTHIAMNMSVQPDAAPGPRTITVTNPDGQEVTSASGILTIQTGCPTITLSPSSLPGGTAGSPYAQSVSANGGVLPYTFLIQSGALPAGVTLSSAGLLSGTPTYGGTFNFTVQVSDSNNCSGSRAYALTITGCPQIITGPASLGNGTVGASYNAAFSASGGKTPYTYSLTGGSLPAGLTLLNDGTLLGTPTSSGTFPLAITATDSNDCTGTVTDTLVITTGSGQFAVNLSSMGSQYTQKFNTLAGSGTSGNLPAGWSIAEHGTGENGTYTAGTGSSSLAETYSFGSTGDTDRCLGGIQSSTFSSVVGAMFANNTGSTIQHLSISYTGEEWRMGSAGHTDSLQLELSTDATNLVNGTWTPLTGLTFSSPVTSGSVGPLNGNLPPNRTLLSAGVSGLSISAGSTFLLRWFDANAGNTGDGIGIDDFTITPYVSTRPSAVAHVVPDTVHAGYPTLLKVNVLPGTFPFSTGITVRVDLSSIAGSANATCYNDGTHGDQISGDSTWSLLVVLDSGATVGAHALTLIASDAQLRADTVTVMITVEPACPPIVILPSTLRSGMVTIAYAETLTATGGNPPYLFALASGNLPHGLTLTPGGIISGNPTTATTAVVTLSAQDSTQCVGLLQDTLRIEEPSGVTLDVPASPNWNMLSDPLRTTNDSVNILFPTRSSYAFGYNGSSYIISNRMLKGFGYWLKFTTGGVVPITGNNISIDTVPVQPGWNLLGSISQSLPASALGSVGTHIVSRVFGYSNGYARVDTLKPGGGYWVKFDSSGICIIGYSGSGMLPKAADQSFPDALQFNTLTLRDSSGYEQVLYFGRNTSTSERATSSELPPVPPEGTPDVRFHSGSSVEFLPSTLQDPAEYPIDIQSLQYPVRLKWSIISQQTETFRLEIIHPKSGREVISLRGEGERLLTGPQKGSMTLSAINPSQLPTTFALLQNYPNPFNPTTRIGFDIPSRSIVTLSVYNTLGEVVRTLLSSVVYEQGRHVAQFNSGGLSSGVYFYRIIAVKQSDSGNPTGAVFSAVKKMLLLK